MLIQVEDSNYSNDSNDSSNSTNDSNDSNYLNDSTKCIFDMLIQVAHAFGAMYPLRKTLCEKDRHYLTYGADFTINMRTLLCTLRTLLCNLRTSLCKQLQLGRDAHHVARHGDRLARCRYSGIETNY